MKYINYEFNTIRRPSTSFPIALIVSRFNAKITQALKQGAYEQLEDYGFSTTDITVIDVPGAIEIPIVAQRLALKKQVQVIVTLGAVIRGETSHYDYVCEQVSQGCQTVSLQYDLPIIFGILTTENEAQAWDRIGGKYGHKGKEAIHCAVEMQYLLKKLSE